MGLLVPLLTILLTSVLSTAAGCALLRRCALGPIERYSGAFLGLSFFVGHSIFLSVWRISASSTTASFGLYLTLMLFSLVAVLHFRRPQRYFLRLDLRTRLCLLLYCAGVATLTSGYWCLPLSLGTGPWAYLGSGHSIRYANIADYILRTNSIPVIGQSYGQALLAVVPGFFGTHRPLLGLLAWLILSLIVVGIFTYGLLRSAGLTTGETLIGSLLILMGNSALSLVHINIVDTRWPILLNNYPDAVIGVGSGMALLYLAPGLFRVTKGVLTARLFTAVMICFSWSIIAPHNFILIITAFISVALLGWRKWSFFARKRFFVFLIFIVLASLASIRFGGVLSPPRFHDKVIIDGIMSMNENAGGLSSINVNVFLPHSLPADGYEWAAGPYVPFQAPVTNAPCNFGCWEAWLWSVETTVWVSLRPVFFPLAGLLLAAAIVSVTRGSHGSKLVRVHSIAWIDRWWRMYFFLFAYGVLIATGFEFSGRKWELTRFMALGAYCGMAMFVISLQTLSRSMRSYSRVAIQASVIALLLFGPFITTSRWLYMNLGNIESFFASCHFIFRYSGGS